MEKPALFLAEKDEETKKALAAVMASGIDCDFLGPSSEARVVLLAPSKSGGPTRVVGFENIKEWLSEVTATKRVAN
jgi:hypothetical protein